jgi:hypothetical protein
VINLVIPDVRIGAFKAFDGILFMDYTFYTGKKVKWLKNMLNPGDAGL